MNNYYHKITEAEVAEFENTGGKIPYITKMSGWPLALATLVLEGKLTQRQAVRKLNTTREFEISWSCYRAEQGDILNKFHSLTKWIYDERTTKTDGRCKGHFSENNMYRFRGM
jgi:NMD protein affecting ribosome stability and mRNA decay